jgi:hypothetical protein
MSLKVPFVFWNDAPSLIFTSCFITKSTDRIITGTSGGLCVLWNISKTTHVEPFALLSGHESEVVSFTEVVYEFVPCVASGECPG